MSSRSSVFELARSSDRDEILDVLESSSFEGSVSLLYTRRPDAYASLMKEGDDVKVVVCRDPDTGKVGAMGACALRRAWVNGEVARVGYLFGLRSRGEHFRRRPILHRAYAYLREHCADVDYFVTSILEENAGARRLLEKDRPFMPRYAFLGRYHVFALRARRRARAGRGLRLRPAREQDVGEIESLLEGAGERRQFFPVVDVGGDGTAALSDFRLLVDGNERVRGVCALWDQTDYKQYVVGGYHGALRLLPSLSLLTRWLRLPPAPRPGSVLRFFTLSYAVVEGDDAGLFADMLDLAAAETDYPFFLVGVYESDPLHAVVEKRKHIRYTSRIYLVDWDRTDDPFGRLNPDLIPYFECGQL